MISSSVVFILKMELFSFVTFPSAAGGGGGRGSDPARDHSGNGGNHPPRHRSTQHRRPRRFLQDPDLGYRN